MSIPFLVGISSLFTSVCGVDSDNLYGRTCVAAFGVASGWSELTCGRQPKNNIKSAMTLW
jgi:hypothetical protein